MKATNQAKREATQLYRACQVNGLLDEQRARQAVQQMIAAKPRGYLGTLSYFRRLVQLDSAKHTAKIESAVPLSADLQNKLSAGLARVYGAGLATSFAEDPKLIAGMRIRVGSDVYDGSVKARLAALERSF